MVAVEEVLPVVAVEALVPVVVVLVEPVEDEVEHSFHFPSLKRL